MHGVYETVPISLGEKTWYYYFMSLVINVYITYSKFMYIIIVLLFHVMYKYNYL